jgi:hypothetical protein
LSDKRWKFGIGDVFDDVVTKDEVESSRLLAQATFAGNVSQGTASGLRELDLAFGKIEASHRRFGVSAQEFDKLPGTTAKIKDISGVPD